MFSTFSQLFCCEITRGDSPQNSCRETTFFLPRGRKKVAKKEDAARLKFSCVPGCGPLCSKRFTNIERVKRKHRFARLREASPTATF